MKPLLFLTSLLVLSGCTTLGVRTTAIATAPRLAYTDTVRVVNVYEEVPANSELIGKIKSNGTASYRSCLYPDFIAELQLEARLKGANIVKIEELRRPAGGEACFVMRGSLYRNDKAEDIAAYDLRHRELNASSLPDSAGYALIHMYSPHRGGTGVFGRAVKLNGRRLGLLRNHEITTYRATTFGKHHFRIPSLGSSGLLLNIEAGKEYYLSFAEVYDGALEVGTLFVVEPHVGRRESRGLEAQDVLPLTTKR